MRFATLCVTLAAYKASARSCGSSSENCSAVPNPAASLLQMQKGTEGTITMDAKRLNQTDCNPPLCASMKDVSFDACQGLMYNQATDPNTYSWSSPICHKWSLPASPSDPEASVVGPQSTCPGAVDPGFCCVNADCTSGKFCSRVENVSHRDGVCTDTPSGHYADPNAIDCHVYEDRGSRPGYPDPEPPVDLGTRSVCYFRECQPGHHARGSNNVECTACQTGRYQGGWNSEHCECTVRGHYQDNTGQTASKECAPGTISTANCSSSCEQCAAGRYNPSYGNHECYCARIGHRPNADQTGDEICPDGYYNDQPCQPECRRCERQWYFFFYDLFFPYDCNAPFAARLQNVTDENNTQSVLPLPALGGSSSSLPGEAGYLDVVSDDSSSIPRQDMTSITNSLDGLRAQATQSSSAAVANQGNPSE